MSSALNINDILLQVKQLDKDEQLTLLEKIVFLIRRSEVQDKSGKPLPNLVAKYKGAMTKQPLEEIDKQLNDLRNEWE